MAEYMRRLLVAGWFDTRQNDFREIISDGGLDMWVYEWLHPAGQPTISAAVDPSTASLFSKKKNKK